MNLKLTHCLSTLAVSLLFISLTRAVPQPHNTLDELFAHLMNEELALDHHHDKSFLPIAQKYMDEVNNFTAFSPVGLANILSLTLKMTHKSYSTHAKLHQWLGRLASAPEPFFREYAELLKKLGVDSETYFFSPSMSIEDLALDQQESLKNSGAELHNNFQDLKDAIQNVSQQPISSLGLPTHKNFAALLNVFTLKFEWFQKWAVIVDMPFFRGESEEWINFLAYNGPIKTAYQKDTYDACRLDLKQDPDNSELPENIPAELGEQGKHLNPHLAVYLIKMKNEKRFTKRILKQVHNRLENGQYQNKTIYFPRFKFNEITHLTPEEFPSELSTGNQGFSMYSHSIPLELRQLTQFCAVDDESDVESIDDQEPRFMRRRSAGNFDSKFFAVLMHLASGDPLFIGSVDLPQLLSPNERC